MTIEKFLEFEGKKIILVNEDGQFYVALKPICEAIKLKWVNIYKRLCNDGFFKATISILETVGADKRSRKMDCLPEEFIYGYITFLPAKTPEMIAFKRKCYHAIYNYFHPTHDNHADNTTDNTRINNIITNRASLLKQRILLQSAYEQLHFKITEDEIYKRMIALQKQIKELNEKLKLCDTELESTYYQPELAFG